MDLNPADCHIGNIFTNSCAIVVCVSVTVRCLAMVASTHSTIPAFSAIMSQQTVRFDAPMTVFGPGSEIEVNFF
jgi:hypothetical protein